MSFFSRSVDSSPSTAHFPKARPVPGLRIRAGIARRNFSMVPCVCRGMRRTAPLLVALAMVVVAHLWIPRPVAACSCVAPTEVLESAGRDPGSSVFTATAGVRIGDSIPVSITRWLKGTPPVGLAVIEGSDPGDMCGSTSPPAGSEYLFVTYTSETSRLAISGCSVQADLTTLDGAAMLARAMDLFGAGAAPPTEAPAPAGLAPGPDSIAVLAPAAIAIVAAMGIILGLYLVLGRRRGST